MTAALELEPDLELIQAINQVGEDAIGIIEGRYGYSHLPSQAETPQAKHNGLHGNFVGEKTDLVLGYLGVGDLLRAVGRNVGKAHDLESLLGIGENEEVTAEWVAQKLREARLEEIYVQAGELAVIGSKPIIKKGVLVGQQASFMDYPTREAELVSRSLSSADVGAEIYSPEGAYLGHQLYRERNGCRPGQDPTWDGFGAFQSGQIQLLENYKFPLPEAASLFATFRFDTIAYAYQVLRQYERGEFESFRQLLRQDLEFMNSLAPTSSHPYPFLG